MILNVLTDIEILMMTFHVLTDIEVLMMTFHVLTDAHFLFAVLWPHSRKVWTGGKHAIKHKDENDKHEIQ